VHGVSGAAYELNGDERLKAVDRLRVEYDRLVDVWGGVSPALVAIASMLDLMSVQTREGVRPDVVKLLLEAAELVKSPPSATAALAALERPGSRRLDHELALLRRYVEHLRDHIEDVSRHTPEPSRSWTYEEFRELQDLTPLPGPAKP
jgi:hypothetical protein